MSRTLPRILFVVYLIALAAIAFWPTPVDGGSSGDVVVELLRWLRRHGFPRLKYSQLEFAANILFFLPFGVLVTIIGRRLWLGLLLGPAASVLVEGAQALLLPDRHATWWDVVANSIGTVVGALTTALVLWLARPRPAGSRSHR